MKSMAQNVWILPYTSEKRLLHRKEFWEFTYKNALPAAYIMKTSKKLNEFLICKVKNLVPSSPIQVKKDQFTMKEKFFLSRIKFAFPLPI